MMKNRFYLILAVLCAVPRITVNTQNINEKHLNFTNGTEKYNDDVVEQGEI